MTKAFKRGDVVTDISNHEFLILRREDTYGNNYFALRIDNKFYTDYLSDSEISLSKKKPFKVTKGKVDIFDGYVALKGNKMFISVGCRLFRNVKEAKQHWANDGTGAHALNDYMDGRQDAIGQWEERKKYNTKRLAKTLKLIEKAKEA